MPRPSHRPRRTALAVERLEDRVNPVSFAPGDWGWTGSNSMTVSFGEINGDGKIDMAVGTASTGVEIHLNDGNGDFTWLNNITGMAFPEQMELPDLTGDGLADILTGLSFAQWVAVVPNNGDSTFGAPILKDIGVNVQDVDTADFNGDGKLDVVAAVPGGAAVLFNTGTAGILGSPTLYNHDANAGGAWVTVGDFNGDAKPDFAVSVHLLRRVDVYLNDGTGVFTRTQFANPVANDSGDVICGDFNNDGHLDIVNGYYLTGMLGLMRGLGDGNFLTATITHSSASRVGPLAAADFDLDGNLDILTMHGPDREELVLPGKGDGTFASAVGVGQVGFPGDVAVADVNGDGLTDIATSQALSGGNFNISLNTTPVSLSFRISAPAFTTAGEEFNITVTARDRTGAVMTGYTGTVQFSSTDLEAFLPPDYRFTTEDAGVATFAVTLFDDGLQRITVADRANPDMDGTSSVGVHPGELSAFDIDAPTEAVAGEPFDITVTARDEFGNRIVAYAGTVHFTSTDPVAQLPPDSTLSGGTGDFTVALLTPGTWTVSAADLDASIFAESDSIGVSDPSNPPPSTTIVADFGNRGLQRWTEADGWEILSPLNAERAVLSADGTTVIADFGNRGLRIWNEIDGWLTISPANVEKAQVSADGFTVMADFGGAGLRRWTVAGGWTKLTSTNVQNVFLSRDGLTAVADFGWRGLRRWTDGGGWSIITALNPKHVAVDADCTSLAADFAFIGLWRWTALNDEWTRISSSGVEQVFVSADGSAVVADFGHGGLKRWTDGSGWLKLSSLNAERVSISPNGLTVVADFGSRGLRRWTPHGLETLSTANVQDVLLSSTGTVVADFGVDGLQVYDSAWSQLIGLDPEQILTV